MLLVLIFSLLVISQVVIGLLVFLQSRHNNRIEQRIFALLVTVIALWTVANGILVAVETAAGTRSNLIYYDAINRAAFLLAGLLLTGIYYFNLHYPIKSRIGISHTVILGAGIVFTLLGPTSFVAGSFNVEDGGLVYSYGAGSAFIGALAVVALVSMYARQSHIMRHSHDKKLRGQVVTLLAGMTLTMLHALIFIIVLPALFGQHQAFFVIGYAAPIYLVLTTGYGMLRQGLFDVRSIAVRSLAYTLSFGAVSLLYAIPVVLFTTYITDTPVSNVTFALLVCMTLIVAVFFQSLRNYFNRFTRNLFYHDYYEPQDVLDSLGALLVGTVDVGDIRAKSQDILEKAFKPTFMRYLLLADDNNASDTETMRILMAGKGSEFISGDESSGSRTAISKELSKLDAALAVRLRTRHEDLGFILMGFRRSGAAYSLADLRVISVIADELALGLQNALRFQEIEEFNKTLQAKVDEATRKLRKTNERLRTLDQTKDDFISMASHQLRTPLTSVKGYVSMVLDGDGGKINEVQRKLLTQSFLSSQRMVYLISDLLNVSRLRTGKFVIEPVESDLSKVIGEEVEQLMETVKSRGLELTYHKPEAFPVLMLDETKLRQVIMNFIDNAIYYTPTGGHIDVHLVDKGESIEFTVVDDGIGVPRHEQHHLFSKFYRAHNAKRARPDGTGLGLFMAKKVIVAQGGAIIFKSAEGRGSTFGFTFPKAKLLPKKQ